MTDSTASIAPGSDGPSVARLIYRRTPLRWMHNIWWDHRGLRQADVMLCSYPRSGSTWMRFLIFALTMGERGSFSSVGKDLPYVGRHHQSAAVLPGGGRLIKTHEPYNRRYRRMVHLVRDPRDVAVSYWSFMQRIGKIVVRPDDDEAASFDHFIDSMIAGRVDGFSTWDKHLKSYLKAAERNPDDILRIRFEDLRADTPAKLLEVAGFLGLDADLEQTTRAAEQASLESMRQAEDEAAAREDSKFAKDSRRSGIRAVRSGEVGGWRNRLTDAQKHKFLVFTDGMERVGYPIE